MSPVWLGIGIGLGLALVLWIVVGRGLAGRLARVAEREWRTCPPGRCSRGGG